jgi:hypothetical protein
MQNSSSKSRFKQNKKDKNCSYKRINKRVINLFIPVTTEQKDSDYIDGNAQTEHKTD